MSESPGLQRGTLIDNSGSARGVPPKKNPDGERQAMVLAFVISSIRRRPLGVWHLRRPRRVRSGFDQGADPCRPRCGEGARAHRWPASIADTEAAWPRSRADGARECQRERSRRDAWRVAQHSLPRARGRTRDAVRCRASDYHRVRWNCRKSRGRPKANRPTISDLGGNRQYRLR
jgi:hypothetical protein